MDDWDRYPCEKAMREDRVIVDDGEVRCSGYIYGTTLETCKRCKRCRFQYKYGLDEYWTETYKEVREKLYQCLSFKIPLSVVKRSYWYPKKQMDKEKPMSDYESPSFDHIRYLVVAINEHTGNKHHWTVFSLKEARLFVRNIGESAKIYKLEEIK